MFRETAIFLVRHFPCLSRLFVLRKIIFDKIDSNQKRIQNHAKNL